MTEAEARVLRHLHEYRVSRGISPTLQDLAHQAGLASRSGIRAHMQALIALGYVEAASGSRLGYLTSRGYRPTASGLAALGGSPVHALPTCPQCGQPVAAR